MSPVPLALVFHAGSRLLADVADRTTLSAQLAEELAGLRRPRARHDPGRVLVDMAVAVADGVVTISDVAVLADQAELFGAVASDSTCRRLLDAVDGVGLGAVARARAAAREVVWAQRTELTGQRLPPARAAGRDLPGLVIDLDASVVVCHSEKEQAAPTFDKTFGHHLTLAFCDNTGELLAAQLRRGNAGSDTAADHRRGPHHVLDAALAQLLDAHRHGTPILVRADTAGCTGEFLAHLRGRRDDAVSCEFSVGWAITDKERAAIAAIDARSGPTRSTPTVGTATAPDPPRSPAFRAPVRRPATRPGRGCSCAASPRTRVRSSTRSRSATGGGSGCGSNGPGRGPASWPVRFGPARSRSGRSASGRDSTPSTATKGGRRTSPHGRVSWSVVVWRRIEVRHSSA